MTSDNASPGDPVRLVRSTEGSVALIGHCLLPEEQLTLEVERALRTGRPDRLLSAAGACSVVIHHAEGQVLAADDGGQAPLYLATHRDEVVFGSNAAGVAHRVGADVDLVSLAIEVAVPQEWNLNATRTGYAGVRRLTPGHRRHYGPGGVHEVDAKVRPDPFRTRDECAEELRENLSAAVAARGLPAEARLSADLSGGIDSTSLVFLALRHADSLPGLTFSHAEMTVEDDLAHARRFALLDSRIRHHLVIGTPANLPYHDLRDPVDEPTPAVVATGVDLAKATAVSRLGCDTHLVGEGGDLVLSAHHNYLLDLARQRRFDLLWRHCAAWARLRFRSPMGLFTHVLRSAWISRREGILRLVAALEEGRNRPRRSWEGGAITPWGTPLCDWLATPARNALVNHLLCSLDEEEDGLGAGDRAMLGHLRSANRAYQVQRAVGAEAGVQVHAPYLDTQVVRACLSIPSWRKADPAVAKPLLRRALAGLVPDEVLTRRTKGNYTRAAYLGLRRAAPRILRMLDHSLGAEIGLIDPSRVATAVEQAMRGLDSHWAPLNQVLGIELWLRAHAGSETQRR
ncbi:albusnodin/ikarugamycin family macrolactam cyclase [Actinosynnema sp. NPDC059797]